MNDHLGSHFILLLDMNCNIYESGHPYSRLVHDLMSQYDLFSAFDLVPNFDPNSDFTRSDPKTNSFSLIDGILLSGSLRGKIANVRISDYGDNISDHRPVELDLKVSLSEILVEKKRACPTVNWSKLSPDSLSVFRQKMTEKLDDIVVPFHSLVHGNSCCDDNQHRGEIESYYRGIVDAVLYADSFLPRSNPAIHKPYWSDSISELKRKSIDCCQFWRINGCPRTGPIFDCKRRCTLNYKRALRIAKKEYSKRTNDDLFENLVTSDGDAFWKTWRNLNRDADSLVTRVNGETSEEGIAGAFREHFRRVYSNNDTPAHEALKSRFHEQFSQYYANHMNDPIGSCYLSWSDMMSIAGKISTGKSSSGSIRPEHILHGSEKLFLHLHLLFNSMIQHGCVVDDFLRGVITPIVKDNQGDVSDCANYRGITLGGLISKLFEQALDLKIAPYLGSDYLQFGFKRKTSTSHALFTLKSTIDYFNSRGSDVFVAFMDCTKAFDRISHHGLFIKLMDRGMPLCLLLIIMFWHLNMSCRVKWGGAVSEEFAVPLGTKQGGISSPGFFSLYINDLIEILRKSGFGCHIIRVFIGCIFFADDIALMAPSRSALQKMINLCSDYCDIYCLQFNAKKSKVMLFGKALYEQVVPFRISGVPLDFVTEWGYLGVTIVAGKVFSFTARPDISSFFKASNAILNVLTGAHEHTLLTLLHTNCVPILTYACAIKQYSATDMSDCNIAVNNAFRKIFGFKEWQSIRVLREVYGFRSLYDTFRTAQERFISACRSHENPIVKLIVFAI